MRGPRVFFFASVVSANLAWSGLAEAQQKAAAEALFRSGREAAAKGDWVTACDRFAASNQLDPTPGTILNLARCREELGQLASAWQRYQEAAQKLPATDRRHALALERAASLAPRLPRLTLTFAKVPPEVTIEQNGVKLDPAVLGVELPVDPGAQRIVVRAPEHEDWVLEFELGEGEAVEKTLQLGHAVSKAPEPKSAPLAATSPREDVSDSGQSDGLQTWGYVATGAGVLGIGVGAVAGLLALDAKQTMDEADCDGRFCDQAGYDAAKRGSTWSTVSTIGFAAGAASLGVGVYLLFFHGDDGGSVKATVAPTAGGATLEIGGTL